MEYLRQLSVSDGLDVYNLLQHIGEEENAFKNPVKKMSYEEFKQWLVQQEAWSRNENLPDGCVGQTCFWLIVDNIPVCFGKIRHALTSQSRLIGGNIGYAVSSLYRGKGYGTILLHKLLEKANEMKIEEKFLTVEKYNYASKRVIEKNGGKMVSENDYRWSFRF
ncbi:MAG: GNAT family N-acetyltransferase [Bacteroidales bacterium]|nr:GNAT family N-acetyltransferase [Bacteroidales bacterium]